MLTLFTVQCELAGGQVIGNPTDASKIRKSGRLGTKLFYSLTFKEAPSRNEFRLLTQNLATMWAPVAKHIRSSTYIMNTSSLTRSSRTAQTDVDYISTLEIFQSIPIHNIKDQFLCDTAINPPGGRFSFFLQLINVIATPRRRTLTVVFQRAWHKKQLIPDLGRKQLHMSICLAFLRTKFTIDFGIFSLSMPLQQIQKLAESWFIQWHFSIA